MSFFPKPHSIIGIEKEGNRFKICKLVFRKKNWEIDLLETIEREKFAAAIPKDALLVSSIPASQVLIRHLDLPLKNEKDIKEAISFQAEPHLPFPLQSCVIQYQILSKHSLGTHLALYAVKKDHLRKHLEENSPPDNEPEKLTCEPAALASLFPLFTNDTTHCFFLYIGQGSSTFLYVENGNILSSRSCTVGRKNFGTESFSTQIKKTILGFESQFKDKKLDKLLVLGLSQNEIPILEKLSGKEVVIPEMKGIISEDFSSYALAMGSALLAARSTIDFREQEFSYPYKWKRFKKPLLTYFSLCLAASLLLFVYGKIQLNTTLHSLKQDYLTLLAMEEKSYTDLEAKICNGEKPSSLNSLSGPALEKRISLLEKEIKSRPNTFPLMPRVPKVNDFLAWIETHPDVASTPQKITVSSCRYQMVKKPGLVQKQEKYQVKVDLEFQAASPSIARGFHDSLRSANALLDPSSEIQWSVTGGKYRASFFLKDETNYR